MFNVSLSAFVMVVIFGVLIVGTIKAYWSLINDETCSKRLVQKVKSECGAGSTHSARLAGRIVENLRTVEFRINSRVIRCHSPAA